MIRSPFDESGDRVTEPARRLSEAWIRHPEGIERIGYDTATARFHRDGLDRPARRSSETELRLVRFIPPG